MNEKELSCFFHDLAQQQKKGSRLAFVIMSDGCFLEDIYLLLKAKFREVRRRKNREYLDVDVNGEKVRTYYHSPASVESMLVNDYKALLIKSVATLLPPSYLEPFFESRVWLLDILNFLERTFGRFNFLAAKADHYIIIAERK